MAIELIQMKPEDVKVDTIKTMKNMKAVRTVKKVHIRKEAQGIHKVSKLTTNITIKKVKNKQGTY